MEQKIVELTKELMRFKSMHSRPEEIAACLEHIRGYLQEWGVKSETIVHNGVHSLLALPKPGYAPILLMSHADVVEAGEALFEPVEENGRLYGRGSIDDKYAVAVSLFLLRAHLTEIEQEGGSFEDLPFGLLITGDEEVGGTNGAGQALKHCRTDFCLALDVGGPRQIVIKEKGILRLKLVARGKAAHGARPWLGENAIEKLTADIQAIKPFFPVQTQDPEHWHRTMNLGRISGGKAVNQVPDRAEAVFDIRYT
ncbi:MAG: M20 family metallopeptidase, partial [Thermodesulfobacteriota bacterium]